MKKQLLIPILAVLIVGSCKKNDTPAETADTTAPVITLNGRTNDTISLQSNYSDPGAEASDNVDGSLKNSIVVSGVVNNNIVGEYRKYYNVKDAAGNTAVQITRYVYVRNDADYLSGMYNAASNCGATQTLPAFTTSVSVSTTINNEITVAIGKPIPTFMATVTVQGLNLTIPYKIANGVTNYGGGTIQPNKKEFSIGYDIISDGTTYVKGAWNCANNYKKQ